MPYTADTFYRYSNGDPGGFTFPVILLHGGGGSHLSWPGSLRRITGQRVFAPDLPGHGNSPLPPCRSLRCLERALHHFIMEMGFYHVVLVGYSLGGALALTFANAHPQLVAGLVTISCGVRFEVPPEITTLLSRPPNTRKALECFSAAAFHPAFPQPQRRAVLAPAAKLPAHVLRADFSIAADYSLNRLPGLAAIPSLIIGGSEDKLAPPSSLRQLHRYMKRSDLTWVNGAGHMLIYEKNEEVSQIMAAFLARVNPPG